MEILIVDDDAKMVESIRIGLENSGYSAHEALDGKQAMAQLGRADRHIGVVVTDYLMPEMNGVDLLKTIRRDHPSLPVIIMTAYAETRTVIEAMKNHCNGFIEKPFRLDQLVAEIERVKPCFFQSAGTFSSREMQ